MANVNNPISPTLEERFHELVKTWRKEAGHLSLASRMAKHPAYREIVSMGIAALPLLLEELRRETTRQNPVPAESEGKVQKMAEAWIQWGVAGGYIK
jgi:hypothetical protein